MTSLEAYFPFLIIFAVTMPTVLGTLGVKRIGRKDWKGTSLLAVFLIVQAVVFTWLRGSEYPILSALTLQAESGILNAIFVSVGYALLVRVLVMWVRRR